MYFDNLSDRFFLFMTRYKCGERLMVTLVDADISFIGIKFESWIQLKFLVPSLTLLDVETIFSK